VTSRWLGRVAIIGGTAALALALATPAWAAQVTLNNGGVTAIEHDDHSCAQVDGGAIAGRDGWVFVLPGNAGDFVSLTLLFERPDGTEVTVKIPDPTDDNPDDIDSANNNGTAKATVQTPAGWTLVSGTAEITGTSANGKFNLTHTCPSTGPSPSPSPSASPSPSSSKSASPSPSASVSGSGSVGGSPESSTSTSTSSAPGGGGGLPTTGTRVGLFMATGSGLIGAGVALLIVMRRRRDRIEFTA
jgi:hypothetical protein